MVQVSMQNLIENPQYSKKQTNPSHTLSLSDDFFPPRQLPNHLSSRSPPNTSINTLTTRRVNSFINSHSILSNFIRDNTKEISNGLENNKRITSFTERKTTNGTIRHILHTWTQRPLMDNKKLYLYRLTPLEVKHRTERNENDIQRH